MSVVAKLDLRAPSNAPVVCRVCGFPRPKIGQYSIQRVSPNDISESAGEGCPTCSLLNEGIRYAADALMDSDFRCDSLILQATSVGRKSLIIRGLETSTALSFYVLPA